MRLRVQVISDFGNNCIHCAILPPAQRCHQGLLILARGNVKVAYRAVVRQVGVDDPANQKFVVSSVVFSGRCVIEVVRFAPLMIN